MHLRGGPSGPAERKCDLLVRNTQTGRILKRSLLRFRIIAYLQLKFGEKT